MAGPFEERWFLPMHDQQVIMAHERAELLLNEHLTDSQRRTWLEGKYIVVENGPCTYRINALAPVEVYQNCDHFGCSQFHSIKRGLHHLIRRMCIIPRRDFDGAPIADKVLAIKLMIEYQLERFWQTANYA